MRQKSGYLYEFGPFVLDTAQHLLSRQGDPVSLTPKTYDMLLVLVENSGRMMTKSELMKALWPDSFVEESNLTQQVSVIRKALGETPGQDRYIVTVSGRGYRFAATVRERIQEIATAVENPELPESGPVLEHVIEQEASTRTLEPQSLTSRRRLPVPALVAATLGLLVAGYFGYKAVKATARLPAGPRSLAVLPFQSLK